MNPASTTWEEKRLESLHQLRILDTEREGQFDDIAFLASTVLDMPIASVAFVDRNRVWFKSKLGLNVSEVPRESWFCNDTVAGTGLFVVPDTLKDERFQDNVFVSADPSIRFYAGVPLTVDGGKPVGTLCVMDTKARQLTQKQEDVLKAMGNLVVAVLESRRKLSFVADELNINKELAGEAIKAKSSFLANMSHEIRTPMTAILGMADLLMGTELKKDQRDYVNTIRSSGESLLSIINDILDFSKIESGKMELDVRPIDLRACVEETLDWVSPKAHAKGNEVVYTIDANVPQQVMGDASRIRQILANLISNAVKFTQNGEIFLSLTAQSRKNDEVQLVFSVKDTGIGIPKEKLQLIFEAFTQVDSSVTRRYGGAGLGLVICSRLVTIMGGEIGVESIEGQGSRFFFTIITKTLPGEALPRKPEKSAELNEKRILIVDDSLTNLQILSSECKQWGMVPSSVNSAAQALELLKKGEPFDVSIYDMQMPDKDGVQLAIETRELRKYPPLPVVLLSSWDLSDPKIKDNRDLFAATVMKPLKMSQFQALLKDVIGMQPENNGSENRGAEESRNLASEFQASILVAEDNFINQRLIQRMLRTMGYEPVIVTSGLEVMNALDRAAFDLIFMDVQMPDMDGLEATHKIRQRYGLGKGPRIVAMTAFALSGDKERCLKAGMDDYLSKPFSVDQVASMVRKWCGRMKSNESKNQSSRGNATELQDADIRARLLELEQETDPAFVKELIGIFLTETPATFKRLKDAFRAKSGTTVEQLAHKLKGGSLNLGARKLAKLFERMEDLARKDLNAVTQASISAIDQEFEKTMKDLRTYDPAQ